jgi:uncharacterized membrane protein
MTSNGTWARMTLTVWCVFAFVIVNIEFWLNVSLNRLLDNPVTFHSLDRLPPTFLHKIFHRQSSQNERESSTTSLCFCFEIKRWKWLAKPIEIRRREKWKIDMTLIANNLGDQFSISVILLGFFFGGKNTNKKFFEKFNLVNGEIHWVRLNELELEAVGLIGLGEVVRIFDWFWRLRSDDKKQSFVALKDLSEAIEFKFEELIFLRDLSRVSCLCWRLI